MLSDEENEGGAGKAIIKAGADILIEGAKAEQEQQKTLQSGLDLIKRAGTFLSGVFGPAANELGHLFGDQMKFWRFKNAVRILEKAQRIVDERGLTADDVKALGFGDGLRLLEAASLEEDESVQDMWAHLMANAVDPSAQTKPEKMYVDILKSLSGREVVFLDLLVTLDKEQINRMTVGQAREFQKRMGDLAEKQWRRFSTSERNASIQNLIRLRCVSPRFQLIDLSNMLGRLSDNPSLRRWAAVEPHKFEKVLRTLSEQQLVASGVIDYDTEGRRGVVRSALPEAAFMLTALGRDLLRACQPRETEPHLGVENAPC